VTGPGRPGHFPVNDWAGGPGVNQLAAQASQPLIEAAARALVPAEALRRVADAAGCRLAGDVPSAGLAAARAGPDMALIQVLAGRPW
jgi:hypothetical protein